MKIQTRGNKAITLIALVITIVLILAGVTVITITGDNGLLIKATESKIANSIGIEKDKIRLGFNEYQIKKYSETNPELTVEGATVTKNDTQGWTIKFTEHEYTLSNDGTTINGPIDTSEIVQKFTFTISDSNNNNPVTYTAEVGMTWNQWVNSNYNKDNIKIEDGYILNKDKTRAIYRQLQGSEFSNPANADEIIQPNFLKCHWDVDWGIFPVLEPGVISPDDDDEPAPPGPPAG